MLKNGCGKGLADLGKEGSGGEVNDMPDLTPEFPLASVAEGEPKTV
jgi:hypothetical protein